MTWRVVFLSLLAIPGVVVLAAALWGVLTLPPEKD